MKVQRTILVVDDDPDMRSFLRKLLENLGHVVHEAATVNDAFAVVLQEAPHLILLDIKLEGEIGFALLDKIAEVDKNGQIAVVMISALSSVKAIETSTNYNVNGYLVKPVNNTTLLDTLRKIEGDLGVESLDLSDYKNRDLTCKSLGHINRLNEISCLIKSKVKFTHKENISIDSQLFHRLGLDHTHFQVYEQSYDLEPGVYGSLIQFIGLSESNLKAIRGYTVKK